MIAYKLFRKLKDGNITSLFINKKERLEKGKWLKAESYPTRGYKFRPFFHCTETPEAPHLVLKDREWYMVEIYDYEEMPRPLHQGGKWYLAKTMKILNNKI